MPDPLERGTYDKSRLAFFEALRDADNVLARERERTGIDLVGLLFIIHENDCPSNTSYQDCNCVPRTVRYEP